CSQKTSRALSAQRSGEGLAGPRSEPTSRVPCSSLSTLDGAVPDDPHRTERPRRAAQAACRPASPARLSLLADRAAESRPYGQPQAAVSDLPPRGLADPATAASACAFCPRPVA